MLTPNRTRRTSLPINRFLEMHPSRSTTSLTLNSTPTCRLSLHSDPEGALIFVDGTYLGKTTPLTVEINSSDQHRIRLELDGFLPAERNLTVTNDTTVCEHLYSDVYSTKGRSDEMVPERDTDPPWRVVYQFPSQAGNYFP